MIQCSPSPRNRAAGRLPRRRLGAPDSRAPGLLARGRRYPRRNHSHKGRTERPNTPGLARSLVPPCVSVSCTSTMLPCHFMNGAPDLSLGREIDMARLQEMPTVLFTMFC